MLKNVVSKVFWQKCVTIILIVIFALTANVFAGGITNEELFELKELEIFEGDESGDLRLDDNITLVEAMKMVTSCLGVRNYYNHEIVKSEYALLPYSHWAHVYVYEALNIGFVPVMAKEEFNPDSNVNGETALKMIMKVAGYDYKYDKVEFTFEELLAYAQEYGVVDENFKADKIITREEFAKMMVKMFDIPRRCLDSYDSSGKITYIVLDGKGETPFSTYRTFYVNNKIVAAKINQLELTRQDMAYLRLLLGDISATDEEITTKLETLLQNNADITEIEEKDFFDYSNTYYEQIENDAASMSYLKSIGCPGINNFKADTEEFFKMLYTAEK